MGRRRTARPQQEQARERHIAARAKKPRRADYANGTPPDMAHGPVGLGTSTISSPLPLANGGRRPMHADELGEGMEAVAKDRFNIPLKDARAQVLVRGCSRFLYGALHVAAWAIVAMAGLGWTLWLAGKLGWM